jgi:hypothetical protein
MALVLSLPLAVLPLLANGGVYGETSRGLEFHKEFRVAMAKERLTISLEKIRVEYVFRNDSDQDVVTDILFPAASYDCDDESGDTSGPRVGTGFQVWCEGKPAAVTIQCEAVKRAEEPSENDRNPYMDWGGKKVTALLKPLGLAESDFGASNLYKLKPADIVRLWKHGLTPVVPLEKYPRPDAPESEWLRVAAKAIELGAGEDRQSPADLVKAWKASPSSFEMPQEPFPDENAPQSEWLALADRALRTGMFRPNWSIYENYKWKQVFPAKKSVSIVIEYTPIPLREDARYIVDSPYIYEGLPNLEGTKRSLRQEVMAQARQLGRPVSGDALEEEERIDSPWVEYVLTTANTWKGPIEDFELIVEGGPRIPASFAWPRPVERIGRNCYRVRIKNFQPKRNLVIRFFEL